MIRFFVKLQQISNRNITLDADQAKKLKKVLRMKVGEKIYAFDGKGWIYEAELEKITNDFALAKIVDQELYDNESNLVLIQALPKNLKLEFILQKCTELGVDKIVFFESEFSQIDATRISEEKIKRWRKVAQHAAEQSFRIFVPEIELFIGDLDELLVSLKDNSTLYYLHQTGEYLSAKQKDKLSSANFFVGPEGGFSPTEIKTFDQYKIEKVKISDNILRSETAGMAFLSQLSLLKN